MIEDTIFTLAALIGIGMLAGVAGTLSFQKIKRRTFQRIAEELLKNAESDALRYREAAEREIERKEMESRKEIELKFQSERKRQLAREERLKEREDKTETRFNLMEKKLADIERREAILINKSEELDKERIALKEQNETYTKRLEQISGFTSSEAKDLLFTSMTSEVKSEAANFIRKTMKEAEENAEHEASRIIATAINRLAVPCVSQVTVNTVSLPSDEMKGRIIGKEGRNIRALERATGVNILIDDTPNAVVLSGFDPVRLHIAKTALANLVVDGRIHPTKIEEAVEQAKIQTQKQIKSYGEDAAMRAGALNLHPEIITLLGKLKFRYSYGHNILEHSLEVSHLMGLMAGELGLDTAFARRIGLLHDMGKAVTHEVQGTHAVIGHDLALKYGESPEVANGIGCHHHEMAPITIEGSLCHAADAISASRPGARVEAVEEYVKRLKDLEKMALTLPGVEKAYALQAGRELCIYVTPDIVDDDGVVHLARDLTKKIEGSLKYPGKIKVSVTREKRVIEYAM
jgi:ribonuclease Y